MPVIRQPELMMCRYNPTDVGRASKLLQGGGVVGKSLQPYEAHVPFLLQIKIDLNLAGMGWLHLSQVNKSHSRMRKKHILCTCYNAAS